MDTDTRTLVRPRDTGKSTSPAAALAALAATPVKSDIDVAQEVIEAISPERATSVYDPNPDRHAAHSRSKYKPHTGEKQRRKLCLR